jgi:predicted membrane channel-forming protein YqfA (hemolysin III family)
MGNSDFSEKKDTESKGGCLGIFLLLTGIILGFTGMILLLGLLSEFEYKWNENLLIPIFMNSAAVLCVVSGLFILRKGQGTDK